MAVRLVPGPFTVEEYRRLGELGILGEDDRVELLEGQIVQMTPIEPSHAGAVNALTQLLTGILGDRAIVAVQNPVVLGKKWEPRPDVAVLRPRPDAYRAAHPRPEDVLLVIEVADTSLERDRDVKIPQYAAAGIPEAWLVNLPEDVVEVCSEPREGHYALVRTVRRGETLTPTVLPQLRLRVDDILG